MKNKPARRSIRLPAFDYSHPGAYFVTICVDGKRSKLGEVVGGKIELNELGRISSETFAWLEEKFLAIKIEIQCVMPNHIHAVVTINGDSGGGLQTAPTRPKHLGRIVGAYKTHSTVLINNLLNTPGGRFWQRNYYERVIRDEQEYESIWNYIDTNPQNWHADEENEDRRRGEVSSPATRTWNPAR